MGMYPPMEYNNITGDCGTFSGQYEVLESTAPAPI